MQATQADLAAAVMLWQRFAYAPLKGAPHLPLAVLMDTVSRCPKHLTANWPALEAVFVRGVLASTATTRAVSIGFAGDVIAACVSTQTGPPPLPGGFARSERLAAPLAVAWRASLGNSRSQVCVALRRLVEEVGHALHAELHRDEDEPATGGEPVPVASGESDGLWGVILPLVAQAASGELGVTQADQGLLEAAGRGHDAAIVDVRRRRYSKDACDAATAADMDEDGAACVKLLERTESDSELAAGRLTASTGAGAEGLDEGETAPSQVPVPSVLLHAAACPALALVQSRGAAAEVIKCAGARADSDSATAVEHLRDASGFSSPAAWCGAMRGETVAPAIVEASQRVAAVRKSATMRSAAAVSSDGKDPARAAAMSSSLQVLRVACGERRRALPPRSIGIAAIACAALARQRRNMTASLGALDLLQNLSDETGRRLKGYRVGRQEGLDATEQAWVRILACLKGLVLGGEGVSHDHDTAGPELEGLPPGIADLLRPPDASIRDAAMTTACSGVAAHGPAMRPQLLRASFKGRSGLLTTCVSVTASAIEALESKESGGGGSASRGVRQPAEPRKGATVTHHSLNSGVK